LLEIDIVLQVLLDVRGASLSDAEWATAAGWRLPEQFSPSGAENFRSDRPAYAGSNAREPLRVDLRAELCSGAPYAFHRRPAIQQNSV